MHGSRLFICRGKFRAGTWLHALLVEQSALCVGVDINKEGVAAAKQALPDAPIFELDVLESPLPSAFSNQQWDVIVLGEVLEHVDNPVNFLRTLRERFATQANTLIVTVPNAFSIRNFLGARRGEEFINTDHRFWFSPYTLSKVGTQAGLYTRTFAFCHYADIPNRYAFRFVNLARRAVPAMRDSIVTEFGFRGP
ncbi:MAG: methyltransferase domain-containing protein [Polyangiales bacterium]